MLDSPCHVLANLEGHGQPAVFLTALWDLHELNCLHQINQCEAVGGKQKDVW